MAGAHTTRGPLRATVATVVLVVTSALVLGACGGGRGSSRATTSTSASAPCDAAAMVAALQADYGPKVRIVYNGHLVCAGRLAEISVMVDNLESAAPGYSGPVGSPHGALMRYARGAWRPVDLSRPNPYCTPDGRQTAAVPAALGRVCGIQ